MNKQYSVRQVKLWNIKDLNRVCKILYLAGKSMAEKYGLQHWNNSYFKDCVIVFLCVLKNKIFLVLSEDVAVATFQTKTNEKELLFQKLATHPQYEGNGIGSYCMEQIESIAKENACSDVVCEVYDKSEHAKRFYEHKGYECFGVTDTLKYSEVKMRKQI